MSSVSVYELRNNLEHNITYSPTGANTGGNHTHAEKGKHMERCILFKFNKTSLLALQPHQISWRCEYHTQQTSLEGH